MSSYGQCNYCSTFNIRRKIMSSNPILNDYCSQYRRKFGVWKVFEKHMLHEAREFTNQLFTKKLEDSYGRHVNVKVNNYTIGSTKVKDVDWVLACHSNTRTQAMMLVRTWHERKPADKTMEEHVLHEARQLAKQLLLREINYVNVNLDNYLIHNYEDIEPVLRRHLPAQEVETLIKSWYQQLVPPEPPKRVHTLFDDEINLKTDSKNCTEINPETDSINRTATPILDKCYDKWVQTLGCEDNKERFRKHMFREARKLMKERFSKEIKSSRGVVAHSYMIGGYENIEFVLQRHFKVEEVRTLLLSWFERFLKGKVADPERFVRD